MKTVDIPILDLKAYENNAKIHTPEQNKQIANSLLKFGWMQPIVITKDKVIVVGHGRLEGAKIACKSDERFLTAPCVIAEELTDEEIKAYRLADNKLNESPWNPELTAEELAQFTEIDMSQFGFDLSELADEEPAETVEDEYNEELFPRAKAKLGDIYQLGRHRLICGDSTDLNVINKLMDGAKADMVLSDPPYGMHLDTDFSTIKGSMKSNGAKKHTEGNKYNRVVGDNDDFSPDLINTFFANFSYCKEMFLFGADYFAELLPNKNKGSWLVWDKRKESQADAIGSEFELVWSRNRHKRRMLRHDWFGFLSSENGADARNRVHPTQKPVTLLIDIIKQWGKDADIIVDLFGGSGSTLIACEQTNRKCYICELEPKYVDIIIDRWEKFTGQKAIKLN